MRRSVIRQLQIRKHVRFSPGASSYWTCQLRASTRKKDQRNSSKRNRFPNAIPTTRNRSRSIAVLPLMPPTRCPGPFGSHLPIGHHRSVCTQSPRCRGSGYRSQRAAIVGPPTRANTPLSMSSRDSLSRFRKEFQAKTSPFVRSVAKEGA